ncbi:MAG: hypothetical protein JXA93_03740 [Anaerolineae bacterium]|nr:hypothetical protein [Anaerolineae bacterium]
MWLTAKYQPVGLFSLKSATATASGAKSLLIPTPFAIKMALLDAACRVWGVEQAEVRWPDLRDLQVAARLPEQVVVTNMFTKILKPRRRLAGPGTQDSGPMGKTIAFREYVSANSYLGLALGSRPEADLSNLVELLLQLNYIGKRGGFVQLLQPPRLVEELSGGYVLLNPQGGQDNFDSRGIVQILDDCGPAMSFTQANIYSGKGIRLGQERVLNHVVLPYQLVRSSKSYTLYKRVTD